jgi:hypothetical protein
MPGVAVGGTKQRTLNRSIKGGAMTRIQLERLIERRKGSLSTPQSLGDGTIKFAQTRPETTKPPESADSEGFVYW